MTKPVIDIVERVDGVSYVLPFASEWDGTYSSRQPEGWAEVPDKLQQLTLALQVALDGADVLIFGQRGVGLGQRGYPVRSSREAVILRVSGSYDSNQKQLEWEVSAVEKVLACIQQQFGWSDDGVDVMRERTYSIRFPYKKGQNLSLTMCHLPELVGPGVVATDVSVGQEAWSKI